MKKGIAHRGTNFKRFGDDLGPHASECHMKMMPYLFQLFAIAAIAQTPDASAANDSPSWTGQGSFFALYVTDARKISDWYVHNLGFRVIHSADLPQSPAVTRGIMVEHGGSFIEIIEPRHPVGDVSAGRPRYDEWRLGVAKLGFVVRDLAALEGNLTKRGVIFNHHSVDSNATKLRTFAIRDPEGNTIQFFGRS